ncbi:MAG: DDE transposase family protein [Selenomonadaceae bacterium]|nr:DDE transposase family protein [Selenomonadaceae bacterium]
MASTLKNAQKKSIAKELYLHGDYTFEEIAAKVETVRQTIARWAKEEGWASLKASMTVGKEKTLKNLYAHVQSINEAILERGEGERTPTPKEADILAKLAAAIGKLEDETGIHELVSSGIAFLTWLRGVDPQKAVEFTELWDAFIKEKL